MYACVIAINYSLESLSQIPGKLIIVALQREDCHLTNKRDTNIRTHTHAHKYHKLYFSYNSFYTITNHLIQRY